MNVMIRRLDCVGKNVTHSVGEAERIVFLFFPVLFWKFRLQLKNNNIFNQMEFASEKIT